MRGHALTIRRILMLSCFVALALSLFVPLSDAAEGKILEGGGNDRFFIYEFLYSGRGYVRIPVSRKYKPFLESDNPTRYQDVLKNNRDNDNVVMAMFLPIRESENFIGYRSIVYSVESFYYSFHVDLKNFLEYKERRKKNRDMVINHFYSNANLTNGSKVNLKYISDDDKSLAYIMVDSRDSYPKKTFIVYFLLRGNIAYNIREYVVLNSNSEIDSVIKQAVSFVRYFTSSS